MANSNFDVVDETGFCSNDYIVFVRKNHNTIDRVLINLINHRYDDEFIKLFVDHNRHYCNCRSYFNEYKKVGICPSTQDFDDYDEIYTGIDVIMFFLREYSDREQIFDLTVDFPDQWFSNDSTFMETLNPKDNSILELSKLMDKIESYI